MDHRLNRLLFRATITTFIRIETHCFGTADTSDRALYSDYINVSGIDHLANDFLSFPQKRVGRLCFKKSACAHKRLENQGF